MSETYEELGIKLAESQNRIFAYLFTLTADREAAGDILQSTNLVIWRKAADYTPGSNFLAWAFQIARYQVLAYRQSCSRDRLLFGDEFVEKLADSMDVESSHSVFLERQKALGHCLGKVPQHQRDIIWLRYREGLKMKEIAERIGKKTNTVEQMMHRLRKGLMDCIVSFLSQEAKVEQQ